MEVHDPFENKVDYTLYGRRRLRPANEPIAVDLSRYAQRTLTLPLDQNHLRNWMLNRDRVRAEPRIRHFAVWKRHSADRPHVFRAVDRRR